MPLREFQCQNKDCEKVVEVLIRHDSHPPEACEKCGGDIKQLFSNTAPPQFKGTGFYSTDYSLKKPK